MSHTTSLRVWLMKARPGGQLAISQSDALPNLSGSTAPAPAPTGLRNYRPATVGWQPWPVERRLSVPARYAVTSTYSTDSRLDGYWVMPRAIAQGWTLGKDSGSRHARTVITPSPTSGSLLSDSSQLDGEIAVGCFTATGSNVRAQRRCAPQRPGNNLATRRLPSGYHPATSRLPPSG